MLKCAPVFLTRRHFTASAGIKGNRDTMSLMEKIKKLLAEQRAIGFQLNASQIQILREPSMFYETLLKKCKKAERRIVIASLYLGTGTLEAGLMTAISHRMSQIPGLSVSVLLDCMRGSRGKENSRTMLLPLMKEHSNAMKVCLYQTPKYRGLLKQIIPTRYNEIIGLQHMKLYLFDDDLIVTGANLSNDYFTHRQDRYVVISDCPPLGDFVEGLCSRVSDFSFQLDAENNLSLKSSWPVHPVESKLTEFVDKAKEHITSFYYAFPKKIEPVTSGDTMIYPLLEMGQLDIHQDSTLTRQLLESFPRESEVRIATGYFNMTEQYAQSIIDRSKAFFRLLMAHPTANGFYEAKGPAGGIPKGYSELAGQFFDRIQARKQIGRIGMLEYSRPDWTFHAKGLWLAPAPGDAPLLTLVGSPNFGERSVHHDLECQFLIATSNLQLQDAMKNECNDLYRHGLPYTLAERQRTPPLWVKIVIFLFKTYL